MLQGQLARQPLAYLCERHGVLGLDLGHPEEMPAERAFDRSADLALREREDRLLEIGRQVAPADGSQLLDADPFDVAGHLLERAACSHALGRLLDRRRRRREQLRHGAALGRAKLLHAALVRRLDLLVADLDLTQQVFGLQGDEGQRPVLGCGVLCLVGLVELRQLLVARRGYVGDGFGRHPDVVPAPLFVAMAIDGVDQLGRRLDRSGDAAGQRLAHHLLPQACQVRLLAQPAGAQQLVEAAAVELAGRLEHRVLGDQRAQGVIRHDQPQLLRLQTDQTLPDQVLQRLLHHPELDRPLAVELGAQLALQIGHGTIERLRELVRGDLGVADGGDRGILTAAIEDVADAPDRERDHEQEQQDLDDPGAGVAAQ